MADRVARFKHHPLAIFIVLAFAALATFYGLVTPVFEASDEARHYAVVKFMADERRLPVQEPGPLQFHAQHEASQPPLYYFLAAVLTAWIDEGDWDSIYWYNPHTSAGVALRTDNENMFIHTDREAFPWRGYALAVHLIRWLSSAVALVTVVFGYRLALELFRGDRWLAAGATALTAFNPMFVFISGAINNDNLVIAFCTIALWGMVRLLKAGVSLQRLLALAIVIGLGALTKLYTVGLIPLAVVVLFLEALPRRDWRGFVRNTILLGAIVAAIAGWWYVRNWLLYGDPTAVSAMLDVVGYRDEPVTLRGLLAEFQGFRIAYWALFGGVNVLADEWVYGVIDVVWLLSVLGLLAFLILLGRYGVKRLPFQVDSNVLIVLLGWDLVVFAGFLRWTFLETASQGRLTFPAIAATSALMTLGLVWRLPSLWRKATIALVSAGLLLFAVLSPIVYIIPAYRPPPILSLADVPPDLPRVDLTYNGQIRLIGVRVEQPSVRATEILPLTAYWEVLAPTPVNYSIFVHLLGRGRQVIGQLDTYPGRGTLPTTLLQPGDVIADHYQVPVWTEAEEIAPSIIRLAMGIYDYNEPGRPGVPALTADGQLVDPLVAEAKLRRWQPIAVEPPNPLSVQFGDHIELTGYEFSHIRSLESISSKGDGTMNQDLTLYWQPTARPSADYTVFIQVWDEDEQVAGFDGPPVGGDYPTSWWEGGEVIVDEHSLDLSGLSSGRYRPLVGLYRLDTGERLPAVGPDGPLPDYAVELKDLWVE